MNERRRLEQEISKLRQQLATGGGAQQAEAKEIDGIRFAARQVEGVPARDLRGMVDAMQRQIGSGVAAVVSVVEGKAAVVVSVSDDLKGQVDAVELVKAGVAELGGKGGGGRADFAQGGGPDGARADAALAAIERGLANRRGGARSPLRAKISGLARARPQDSAGRSKSPGARPGGARTVAHAIDDLRDREERAPSLETGRDHEIRTSPLLGIRHLARADRRQTRRRHAPAPAQALGLHERRRAHHRDRVDPALAAGLVEQGHVEHHERAARAGAAGQKPALRDLDHGVQDRLEPGERRGIVEHPPPERLTVDPAVRAQTVGKRSPDRRDRAAAGASRRWTAASASNTGTPRLRTARLAVDLPMAIEPVRPRMNMGSYRSHGVPTSGIARRRLV